jgi:hypothetical protein
MSPRAPAALLTVLLTACAPSAPVAAPAAEVVIAAPAASAAAPAPAGAKPARDARGYTFDGFKLGDRYGSTVMNRPPYATPCDNDPIDHNARRFMVYGALPCRDRTFPEATTVAFYLAFAEGPNPYDQPIEAFAWLGGGYFATRSSFPVRTGQPASAAAEVLGAPIASFGLERKRQRVTVQRHPGEVWSIVDSGVLVGFVVGPMPADPESEQWRGLMQMYVRYTKPR